MKKIDTMLEQLSRERPSALPTDFEAGVWRAIAHRERTEAAGAAGAGESFLALCERLASAILKPRWVAATAAFVLCAAVGTTTVARRGSPVAGHPHGAQQSQSIASLGLDVFSGHAPALPSTLIAQHR